MLALFGFEVGELDRLREARILLGDEFLEFGRRARDRVCTLALEELASGRHANDFDQCGICLLYTSPSPRDS